MKEIQVSLDYSKVPEERKFELDASLRSTVDQYQLDQSNFQNDLQDVYEGAARFLQQYEVSNKFLQNPEKLLFTLAITDEWLSSTSLNEKKGLLDVFKIVAIDENSEPPVNTSARINRLADKGYDFAADFVPEEDNLNYEGIREYVKHTADIELTNALLREVEKWDENSILYTVRQKANITPETEIPFELHVLTKKSHELQNIYGYPAFYFEHNQQMVIVLPEDYELSEFEHEYMHAQVMGLATGYLDILFRGVDEGITETFSSYPSRYIWQRIALNEFYKQNEGLVDKLREAYLDRTESKTEKYIELFKTISLKTFLLMSRLSPMNDSEESLDMLKRAYISPVQVLSALDKNRRRS